MASLALSLVGTAIGGPIGGAIGGIIGSMIDNVLFPASKPPAPTITTSTYGNAIPIAYGPLNRLGTNMIWTSGPRISKTKSAKKGQAKGEPPQYSADLAFAVGRGPWEPSWLRKIWANGTVIFDAAVAGSTPTPDANGVVTWNLSNTSHQQFDTITVYPGNNLQNPDPTIEAKLGIGNVSAYRGTSYFVMTGLNLTGFGNSVPILNVLVQAQGSITIAQVVLDVCRRSGIDTKTISTSALTQTLKGYQLTSQVDGVSAIQPLALCFDFDLAEVSGNLRCTPRGMDPFCTITNDQLAGFAYGDQQPDAFDWPREPEATLPQLAALTFNDPARDCNANTQSARRNNGSATSNISQSVNITMSSDDARKVCDRMLWEAHIGRQALNANIDDRLIFVEGAKTYCFDTPTGREQVRITKRTRGVNGVIEIEGKRDFSSLYFSTAPGATAEQLTNLLAIGGPVNPPVFIEPPRNYPGATQAMLLIAISGGDGTTASSSWQGCNVYVSTNDSDFAMIGTQLGACGMGRLTAGLPSFGGSNPDTGHHLFVNTAESAASPPSMSPTDAQDALLPYFVGGEFLSAEDVTDLGDFAFQIDRLYRGLYSTDSGSHAIGDPFVMMDDRIFRFPMPQEYIGRTLYFRFVGAGETLASTVSYVHAPSGSGYGTGTGGVPSAPSTPAVESTGIGNTLSWDANPTADNATTYTVLRADGAGALIGAASPIATVAALTYTDTNVATGASYTYFIMANNVVGASDGSSGSDGTVGSSGVGPMALGFQRSVAGLVLSDTAASWDLGFAYTLPAGLVGSKIRLTGASAAAPAADVVFDVQVNGVSVGSMTMPSGLTVATFIAAADAPVAIGQLASLITPANLHGMAGLLVGSLGGVR